MPAITTAASLPAQSLESDHKNAGHTAVTMPHYDLGSTCQLTIYVLLIVKSNALVLNSNFLNVKIIIDTLVN